jgi:hypothetical protein
VSTTLGVHCSSHEVQQPDARHRRSRAIRLVDRRRLLEFCAKSPWTARGRGGTGARSPSGFLAAKIFVGYLSYIEVMQLTNLSFEEWIEHAFSREVHIQQAAWYFDPNHDLWDPKPVEAVA